MELQSLPDEDYFPSVSRARKFGRSKVFLDSSYIFLGLGPDYCCFIPTFIMFCVVASFVSSNAIAAQLSVTIKTAIFLVSWGECLFYLLVALSDPGIAQPHYEKSYKFKSCALCQFSVPVNAFHCMSCGVCIIGFDHHCPWTSKCIGKNNLRRFYLFLGCTPVFFISSIATMAYIGAQNLQSVSD